MSDQDQFASLSCFPTSKNRIAERDHRSTGTDVDYKTLLTIVEDAVVVFNVEWDGQDATFTFEWNNSTHESTTGITPDEYRGQTPYEIFGEELGSKVGANYRRCIEAQDVIEYDERREHPARTVEWHTKLTPVIDDGVVVKIVGISRDITERKQQKRDLQQLESLLSDMEEMSNIGAYEVNLETEEVWWTDGMRRIFDVDDSFKPTVENSIEFYHPADRDRIVKGYEEQLSEGGPNLLEARIITANGIERWVEAFGYPLEIDGAAHLRGYVQDITERKENERKMERSRELLSKTEQLAATGGWELDCRTDDLRWTDGTRRIFGVPDGYDPTLTEAIEFYHPDDRARIRTLVERCRERGERYNEVLRINTTGGYERLVRSFGQPVLEDGEVVALRGAVLDVTDQKTRKDRLRRYKRAIEGANDLICAFDRECQYLFANPQYCRYHEIDRTEIAGLTLKDVFDEEEYTEIKRHHDRTLQGETVQYQMIRTHPTLGRRILDVHYYPLRNEGEISGMVAILRDVTDREERTKHLQVVDRMLRHNIRNDLNIIQGWATLISPKSESSVADAADQIVERSNRLLTTSEKARTITDILIEESQIMTVKVDTMVARIAELCAERWSNTRRTVDVPGSTTLHSSIHIPKAVEELVSNAFIHPDRESPSVEFHISQTEDIVQLSVIDDGPGISEMDRVILERGQAPDNLSHGSGLGMWMVYWIVRRSNGEVTVNERDSRGSIVSIHLPKASRNR